MVDYDGTIVTFDTGEYVLTKFAGKEWRTVTEQLERGQVGFDESLQKEFGMLKVSEQAVLDALEPVVEFRPNFDKLVGYCRATSIPLLIVSGGLDFSIRHFLEKRDVLDAVEIYGPKSKCTDKGMLLTFPEHHFEDSTNFKEDLVRYTKSEGKQVLYVGNGIGDYAAAKLADQVFAIKGSKLAELCRRGALPAKEVTDFQEVVDSVRD